MTISTEDATKIIVDCAKLYKENLLGKNLFFIFGNEKKSETLEARFDAGNFLHLTGIQVKHNMFKGSKDFFDACISGQLSSKSFELNAKGTSEMKLSILPQMMDIHKTAKMVGDFNHSKSLLVTDRIAGNVTACMGFVHDNGFYIPNTVLKEDIRDLTQRPQKRVLAIYRKTISETQYNKLCYIAKGIDLVSLKLPDNVIQ